MRYLKFISIVILITNCKVCYCQDSINRFSSDNWLPPISCATSILEAMKNPNEIIYLVINNEFRDYAKLNQFPEEIRNLKNLKYLNLDFNYIKDIPSWIIELSNLELISLGNNNLNTLPSDLSYLKQLKILYLNNNYFKTFPDCLVHIATLEDLNLSYNYLMDLPSNISNLKNLNRFSIEANLFAELPRQLLTLSNLEILNVGSNRIRIFSFCNANLVSLDLGGNEIENVDSDINRYRRLNILLLDYNKLNMIPSEIYTISNLETLVLDSNNLKILPIKIKKLRKLKQISVRDMGVNIKPSIYKYFHESDISCRL